jgi:hypothetical protein
VGDRSHLSKWLIVILVVAGLALVGFFGWRTFRDHRRWEQRRQVPLATDVEAIRGWMTLHYVALTYGVPPPLLSDGLGIPQEADNRDLSLTEMAEKYGRDSTEFLQTVQQIVRSHIATRAAEPPPPGPPPPPGTPGTPDAPPP